MTVIPEDFGQVTWFWRCSENIGVTAETTWGVALTGTPAPAGLLSWHSAAMNDLMDELSFTWFIEKITLQVGGGGPLVEASLDHHGGGSNNSTPANVAGLIKKGAAVGGRANRGRMFVPGLEEGNVNSGGVIETSYLLTLGTAAQSLLTDDGVISSGYILHSEDSPGDPAPTFITSLVFDPVVATQRRRQRR